MRILFLILFISILQIGNSFGSSKIEIYNSFINNNMSAWKGIIDKMDKKQAKSDKYLLELLNYQYGYIAYALGNNNTEEAIKYIDIFEKNIQYLLNKKYSLSMMYAYSAALYGYKIDMNKVNAPVLGPKSKQLADEARKHTPSNWFAYLQLANIENYTPKILGGSKVDALKYYLIALKLLETNPKECQYNWNYLNLYVTIAQVYLDMNNLKKAEKYYTKVLEIEPNFKWVKYNLYPKLKQLLEESN